MSHNISVLKRWEALKENLIKWLKSLSRQATSDKQLAIAQLSEVISVYEEKFLLTQQEMEVYTATKMDLQELLMEHTRSLMFRSKAKWYAEGEKNTKYFLNLERTSSNSKTMQTLLTDDGILIEDLPSIIKAQQEFYANLYAKDTSINFELSNNTSTKLTEDEFIRLNNKLTLCELKDAVSKMCKGKAPGPDGLTAELYHTLWPKIGHIMYDSMTAAFESNRMFPSAMTGVLNLIPKGNKDTRKLQNLRPITLLNVDYKIIEKALALRIQSVIQKIIHSDQVGFMSGRRISTNIRKIFDMMKWCENNDKAAFILSLDYMKAFDRCEARSVLRSLEYFNFPPYMVRCIKTLYDGFTVRVQNYGHFSDYINVERSIHQGGCLSAFLFNILVETLAIEMRAHLTHSITVNHRKYDLSQYADDTDIFSLFNQNGLDQIKYQLNRFEKNSGLKVNYEKTAVYRIGSVRNSDAKLYTTKPLAWNSVGITVLGIFITHTAELLKINYEPLVRKVKSTITSWNTRNISLIGKVAVVNSLIGSLFVHKMMVLLNIPSDMILLLESEITKFLWNNKKPKISTKKLYKDRRDGGLNLVNLRIKEMSLKATWPQILSQDESLANLVFDSVAPTSKKMLFKYNIAPKDVSFVIPKEENDFWHDTLAAWAPFYYMENGAYARPIWLNSNIRVSGKPIWWEKSFLKGLMYLQQIDESEDAVLCERFSLSQMQLNTLRSIKLRLNAQSSAKEPYTFEYILAKKDLSRFIYKQIVGRSGRQQVIDTWEDKLDIDVTPRDSELLYQTGRMVTHCIKLRSFHYRFMQRALVLNSHLFRWNIIDSNTCSFCGNYKETIEHLFWECTCSQELWMGLKEWLTEYMGVIVILNHRSILFNQIVTPSKHAANFICLVTKQYIYKERCMKNQLSLNALKENIILFKNIEKYNAIASGNIKVYNDKWHISD